MTTTASIGQTAAGTQDPVKFSDGNGFNTLKTEDFVKLLVTQLQNQNPLEPLKDNELLQQVSSINSLSANQNLVETLSSFGLNQSVGAASNLIGRDVTAKIGRSTVTGTVEKVVIEEGKVFVLVGENKVPLDKITSVEEANGSTAKAADLLANIGGGSDPPTEDLADA
ncbi:flagellar hook capping protein [bacterium]|nr:flagellar hook capping protein [bacterium]